MAPLLKAEGLTRRYTIGSATLDVLKGVDLVVRPGEVVAVAQPGRVDVGDRVVVMPQYPCGKCQLCLDGDYIHCEETVDFVAFTGGEAGLTERTDSAAAWAPFLIATLVTWGLLPRLFLRILTGWMGRRTVRYFSFNERAHREQ